VKKGTVVNLRLEMGRMVVAPVQAVEISLRKLLAKVTRKNVHVGTDWGRTTGKEIW